MPARRQTIIPGVLRGPAAQDTVAGDLRALGAGLSSVREAASEPSEEPVAVYQPADPRRSPAGLHRRPGMAAADDVMQLPIGEFEKAPRLTVSVRLQSGCAQQRIIERNRERGSVRPHPFPNFRIDIFGPRQGREAPQRISLEQFRPALYPLPFCCKRDWSKPVDDRNRLKFMRRLVLHCCLLWLWRRHLHSGAAGPAGA
ncbi:hypothetical protein MPLSOD_120284 [Mesorhizobium sp. SOD10]|nr:hypothetical protein MPLSOD_120284 [Mesorhizobium sp. SOD10]